MSTPQSPRSTGKVSLWWTALAVLIFLVPSGYGFSGKLYEFVTMYRYDADGAFAISPMANYLLASLGFLCMLIWGAFQGMFRDIERPKRTMLMIEEELDREIQH